jgi:hypothetical protein
MNRWAYLTIVVSAVLAMAPTCVPPTPPIPPDAPPIVADDAATVADACPDALPVDDPGACQRACANLAAHGCEEMGQACLMTCDHLIATGLTPFSAECVYGATTLPSLRKCPAVKCVQGH